MNHDLPNAINLLRQARERAPAESQRFVSDAIQDVVDEARGALAAWYAEHPGPIDGNYQRVALCYFIDELYELLGRGSPGLSEEATKHTADDERAFAQELIGLRQRYAPSAAASLRLNRLT
jgi:hypothetical protein